MKFPTKLSNMLTPRISARRTFRGFMIIELLVVVSIIGMLSSVIMVALQGAREKGRVGSVVKFATYNYHKLGVNAILDVDFNEAGTVAPKDKMGNFTEGLNIARVSDSPLSGGFSFSIPTLSGSGILFDRTTDLITSPSTSDHTMSMWFKSSSAPSSVYLLEIFDSVDYNTLIYYSADNLRCYKPNGQNAALSSAAQFFSDGKWHNVVCSQKGNTLSMYFDGKFINSATLTQYPTINYKKISIGSGVSNGGLLNISVFNGGLIDNVQIYSEALTSMEIQQKYAEGMAKRGLAVEK